ncbi:MAG: SGNH/GDSL hydrolase family protein [Candidatus Nealsonbacteria bacterium]|nr:SGNH/GDSL hydrolase family protein [Candidatus Nealsonbacteria bacterium]
MKQVVFCVGLVLLLAVETRAAERPLKVLFVGNSYTAANDLPGLITALAAVGDGRKIESDRLVRGGCTFERHVTKEGALEKILAKPWDVVVLQEQSMMPVADAKKMHQYARKLHAAVDKRGARTVFFLTWARQHLPEMQPKLNEAYFSIADELHATVAPVGVAWKNAMEADPKLVLHKPDKSHPNATGSYLAACVFYATLLEKSPEGLPGTLKRQNKTLVQLDAATARQLQTIAWKAVKDAARKGNSQP